MGLDLTDTRKKLLLYFLASGLAALVNFVSRFGYDLYFSFGVSVVFAYCTGMVVNFSLSKLFVFGARKSGNSVREGVKFIVVAGGGLLVTTAVSLGAAWALGFSPFVSEEVHLMLAHACGMGAGFIANFAGHRFVSFRETGLWSRFIVPRSKAPD